MLEFYQNMVKLGVIQTVSYRSNNSAIREVSKLVEALGKKETDIISLPEQWLYRNDIADFEYEFKPLLSLAKEYEMTIIPGAFYHKNKGRYTITSPVIGSRGEIIGEQEKIHPFSYEKKVIKHGTQAKLFKTKCKFGIIICYDMVFPRVANLLAKKGAQVLFSPSRIVRPGIIPWHLYIQARALENRIPILAANVENKRFGGKSVIVDLIDKNKIVLPKILARLEGEDARSKVFVLNKYKKNRDQRFSDEQKFN